MKISVTQKHIDKGVKRSCGQCPIALALVDSIKGSYYPFADPRVLGYCLDNKSYRAITPDVARNFMHDFDYDRPVVPFEFEVNFVN
jgi:hypothetical protein